MKRDDKPENGEQSDHVFDVQLSGPDEPERVPRKKRRSAKLRVITPLQLPPNWEIRSLKEPGAPKIREDCESQPRPCQYIGCKHHLWLRLSEEQPGNPKAGKQGETTFRPSTMNTCALDLKRGMSVDEIGEHFGVHPTRVRQIAEGAIMKLFAINPELAAALMEAL